MESIYFSNVSNANVSVPDLQARVDDIVIFNWVGVDAYTNVLLPQSLLEDLYDDTDGDTKLNPQYQSEDGWHWYPVDTQRQSEFNKVFDETTTITSNYQFSMMDVNETQIPSYEGLYYYYSGNGRWSPN